MQALSRREETEVVERAKKEALKECDDYVRGKIFHITVYIPCWCFPVLRRFVQNLQNVRREGLFQWHGLVKLNSTLGPNV